MRLSSIILRIFYVIHYFKQLSNFTPIYFKFDLHFRYPKSYVVISKFDHLFYVLNDPQMHQINKM